MSRSTGCSGRWSSRLHGLRYVQRHVGVLASGAVHTFIDFVMVKRFVGCSVVEDVAVFTGLFWQWWPDVHSIET